MMNDWFEVLAKLEIDEFELVWRSEIMARLLATWYSFRGCVIATATAKAKEVANANIEENLILEGFASSAKLCKI